MDLDYNTFSGFFRVSYGSKDYYKKHNIAHEINNLTIINDGETPEEWCARIRGPFMKILKENPDILSGRGYIGMYRIFVNVDETEKAKIPWNYIYCSVCDSLVFTPGKCFRVHQYHESHFRKCISGDKISMEQTKRKEILKCIDDIKYSIWRHKQNILREEADLKRHKLELSAPHYLSHSEKDKLAKVSYNIDMSLTSHETYMQNKNNQQRNTSVDDLAEAYFDSVRK